MRIGSRAAPQAAYARVHAAEVRQEARSVDHHPCPARQQPPAQDRHQGRADDRHGIARDRGPGRRCDTAHARDQMTKAKSDAKPVPSTANNFRLKTRIKAGVNNENIPTWQ